jgi:hypothetical protein
VNAVRRSARGDLTGSDIDAIVRILLDAGLSIQAIADAIGVNSKTLHRWGYTKANGWRRPTKSQHLPCTRCGSPRDYRATLCKTCYAGVEQDTQTAFCRKCKTWRPFTDFSKRTDPNYTRPVRSHCKECERLEARERYRANPQASKARTAVARALRAGTLRKGVCEVCGATKVDAHHENYDRPLEVHWLCRRHHLLFDRTYGR